MMNILTGLYTQFFLSIDLKNDIYFTRIDYKLMLIINTLV